MADIPFDPDWTVAPAATLEDWLGERGIDVSGKHAMAAGEYGHLPAGRKIGAQNATAAINAVLDRQPLTEPMARTLWEVTGISIEFWLNFERQYRADLAAGRKDVTHG